MEDLALPGACQTWGWPGSILRVLRLPSSAEPWGWWAKGGLCRLLHPTGCPTQGWWHAGDVSCHPSAWVRAWTAVRHGHRVDFWQHTPAGCWEDQHSTLTSSCTRRVSRACWPEPVDTAREAVHQYDWCHSYADHIKYWTQKASARLTMLTWRVFMFPFSV